MACRAWPFLLTYLPTYLPPLLPSCPVLSPPPSFLTTCALLLPVSGPTACGGGWMGRRGESGLRSNGLGMAVSAGLESEEREREERDRGGVSEARS